jgi:TonB-linked SusC/RagA family outer membrane protein
MKWKSIFKKQSLLLLLVGTVMSCSGVYAGSVSVLPRKATVINFAEKVTGKVTDANGVALSGVTVMVKGTAIKTITGQDGTYSLEVANNNAVLIFSMVGFYTIEKKATQSLLNVSLLEDVKKLDEVVVIGYGSQKKGDLTGSVATVSGEKLNQGINQSVSHALQGQASGVTVIQNSGEPGAGVEIRIRGAGSINDNSPLYVVDGMVGGIGNLNPADIESMTVLKDAASAAIYGARAANGVVIVTTKKGKRNQKTTVSLSSSTGLQSVWKMPTSLDAAQRNLIHKEALTNDGVPSSESIWSYYNDAANGVTRTDWFKEVFQSAMISNHNLSVQGGGEKSNYLFSLGYMDNNGIVLGTNYKRYNVRFNSQQEILNNLTFGENFSIVQTNTKSAEIRGGYDGVLSAALFNMRNTPVWADQANSIYGTPTGDFPNPVASLNARDNNSVGAEIRGNVYLEYKLHNLITFKTDFGYNSFNGKNTSFQAIAIGGGRGLENKNSYNESRTNSSTWIWNNTASLDKRFGNHHLSGLAGMSAESYLLEGLYGGTAYDFTNESAELRYYNNAGNFPNHVTGGADDNTLQSYFGRVGYEFSDKYLFAANFRADGSSKFGTSNRWGYFPSVSGGWRISKESFFDGLSNVISDFKLRASWGQLGNDKIPNYQYYTTVSGVGSPTLDGAAYTAVAQNRLANADIKWEVTTQTDIGIDMSFLNDQFSLTADYFNKLTTDILVQVPLVASLGVGSAPYRNAGDVSNKGFDLGLTYRNRNHAFKYSITANVASVTNKLNSFGIAGSTDIFAAGYKNTDVGRIAEGQPLGHFFVYNALGIFQSQAEVDAYTKSGQKIQPSAVAGDVKFEDRNGDGVISASDRFNAGNSFPTLTGSLNFNGEYKGFDFSMLWVGSQGNKIFNGLKLGGVFMQGSGYNNSPEILNRWTPANRSNTVPRVTINDPNNNKQFSTLYLEDGSYARLKYLTIGYTLDKKVTGDKISKLRLYLTMQNLITVTNYSGYDPEVGAEGSFGNNIYGLDKGTYPIAQAFIFGVNFNF